MFNAGICNLAAESETKDHKAEICVDTRGTAVWTDRQQSRQDSLETRANMFLCVFKRCFLGGILHVIIYLMYKRSIKDSKYCKMDPALLMNPHLPALIK